MPEERTAPTVNRIFELYTREQLGTAAVARVLDDEHAPAPAAGRQPAVVQWVLENEAYLGRVIWRGESLPGLHEPLIDELTFTRARRRHGPASQHPWQLPALGAAAPRTLQARLRRHGRHRQRRHPPLLRVLRPPEKLGPKGCDGERIPRDKLETSVVAQLAALYRNGDVIHEAIEALAEQRHADAAALEEQRRGLSEEIRRADRALQRYYAAFETGDLDAKRFQTRVARSKAASPT